MKCVSSPPCIPRIFQRHILSLHDIVRNLSPRRIPSQVCATKSDSIGIVPSPRMIKSNKGTMILSFYITWPFNHFHAETIKTVTWRRNSRKYNQTIPPSIFVRSTPCTALVNVGLCSFTLSFDVRAALLSLRRNREISVFISTMHWTGLIQTKCLTKSSFGRFTNWRC